MTRHNCWTCGNSYDGWDCPVCTANRNAEERSHQSAKQHSELVEATEWAAVQQAEQAQRLEEQLEEQKQAIEEASLQAQMAAAEAAERHRTTTANAWKLQSRAKSERAYSLYQSGMFDEALRLSMQAVEQDPGNLDGFWVAASSLISLGQYAKAKSYVEKQIQLLNLSEYRDSPQSFVQVLNLISSQKDLLLLGSTFSVTFRKSIGYWRNSKHFAEQTSKLADTMMELEMLGDAKCAIDWLLQTFPCSAEILGTILRLSRLLIAAGQSSAVGQIVDALAAKSESIFSECYLVEIQSLLGKDGTKHLDGFLQQVPIESRAKIESDIPLINKACEQGQLSQETRAQVMRRIYDKYSLWKPIIESQLFNATAASAKSINVRTFGWVFGILSLILLRAATLSYLELYGIQPRTVGEFFPFGLLFGAILIGILCGRMIKRLRIYWEMKNRLTTEFAEKNKTFADLGLPPLALRLPSGSAYVLEFLGYAGIIVVYVGALFFMLSAAGESTKTITSGEAHVTTKHEGPLTMGVRKFTIAPHLVQTYVLAGGAGVDVQLVQVSLEAKHTELVFRVRARNSADLLLYEPPGSKDRKRSVFGTETKVDTDFEELYIQDDTGTKYYSTTGFIGGRQVSWNDYNFIRRINFGPREEIVLSAKFPAVSANASTITFVSPALNGWQSEWRWTNINLR